MALTPLRQGIAIAGSVVLAGIVAASLLWGGDPDNIFGRQVERLKRWYTEFRWREAPRLSLSDETRAQLLTSTLEELKRVRSANDEPPLPIVVGDWWGDDAVDSQVVIWHEARRASDESEEASEYLFVRVPELLDPVRVQLEIALCVGFESGCCDDLAGESPITCTKWLEWKCEAATESGRRGAATDDASS